MKYANVVPGRFLCRPNRFIAHVEVGGQQVVAHVKNTGRCRELLVPGCTVYLAPAADPARKTKYDLIAVEKQRGNAPALLINMDSQAPNAAAEEWLRTGALFSGDAVIRREVRHGASRFDFYVEDGGRRAFLEVKGVTLEDNGAVLFPDAPTERGIKHIQELTACLEQGYEAYILFVVQLKGARLFRPNDMTHPAFGAALRAARAAGVHILAMDCRVTPGSMVLDAPVPVEL